MNRGEVGLALGAPINARTREVLPVSHAHPDNRIPLSTLEPLKMHEMS